MTAVLMTVALAGPASAASAKWTIWQYSGESGPSPIGAANPHGGTIDTVTYELAEEGGRTTLTLTQDNNATQAEADAMAEKNWGPVLQGLKATAEK